MDGLLWLLVLAAIIVRGEGQDYSVYGLFRTDILPENMLNREINEVTSKCFSGRNLVTCLPNFVDDDIVLAYSRNSYLNLDLLQGSTYCVDCCGTSPDHVDVWDLSCEVDSATSNAVNQYGLALFLARNAFDGDTELIRCPMYREGCTYREDGTIQCLVQTNYLHGYTVTITVQQYDLNFVYWRGVSKCEISVWETTEPLVDGDLFYEKFILVHEPINTFSYEDYTKMSFIGVSIAVFVYCTLYFCRRKRCEYCQQKLVFNFRLCAKCICVGAERPDPVLLAALEERGLRIQGKPPERFPGAEWCKSCLVCLGSVAVCRSCHSCCYNCCCKCCCGPSGKVKVAAGGEGYEFTPSKDVEGGDPVGDEPKSLGVEERKEGVREGKEEEKEEEEDNEEGAEDDASLADDGKKKKKKKRKKHVNPNLLNYPPDVIRGAVLHLQDV